MSQQQSLQPNDRIAFDVQGSNKIPYGYGYVTRPGLYGGVMITPDIPFGPNVKPINIRKVSESEVKKA